MIRLLWIPVLGTLAALAVILLAHAPREVPPEDVPEEFPDAPEFPFDEGEEEEPPDMPEEEDAPVPPPPPPTPLEFQLRLEKGGGFTDLETADTWKDVAALLAELGEARHTILLTNGPGVTEEDLQRVVEELAARFVVRKVYSAPR